MNTGALLAFEGLDGSGKSTQVRRLVAALEASGVEVLETREPTSGPVGRRIREMARSGNAVAPELELEWFFEDRREHVQQVIAPALAAGQTVVTDRYYLSTVAYQGARGLDAEDILRRSEAEFPVPDLALLLDLEPRLGIARVEARGGEVESVFERLDFLEIVHEEYRRLDRPYLVRVAAAADPEDVQARIAQVVGEQLNLSLRL
ncbi:dTMP kinase [Myxococcota bacterium]|nr:dTMP kinase [Myxococcota bacterium]